MWAALAYLVFWDDVGRRGVLDPRTMIAFALLLGAPAATFIPLSRWASAPLYDIEGIAGWGSLGFMLAFVEPRDPLSLGQFVAFLIALTVALATAASMIAYLVGLRVVRTAARRRDFLRARRQGYIAAFYVVSITVLSSVGTLTLISAAMMLVLVILVELLALAHTSRNLLRAGVGPRRAGGAGSR
ncbi:MAG TPA: hypothetical protein VMM78_18925 [Thermomicrobiales bacterium]|nr:hypothetical protein [Thermomicrobiales bacterium]